MNSRVQQPWFSIARLAWMYEFSEKSILTWVKAGKFGPVSDTSYVLQIGSDWRVSALGCFFFESSHPARYDDTVRARNAEELKRRLKQAKAPELEVMRAA
jgi:hypothetical protein